MDVGSALRVLVRRWPIVLIGVMLTVFIGDRLYSATPPSYQASARMLLLLPADARGAEDEGSPFLYLPNGLNVLAEVVAVAPNSREFRANMLRNGLVSSYEVGLDPTTPIITISVEGPDIDNVSATRESLIEQLGTELDRVQSEEGVPAKQNARFRVYAAADTPQELGGNGLRGLVAIAAVGGLMTLLMVFGLDRLLNVLAARRAARPRKVDESGPQPLHGPST